MASQETHGRKVRLITDASFRFTHAITRIPPRSAVAGLRSQDHGDPEIATLTEHHRLYVQALRDAGLEVTTLEALEEFPDSLFVEDTALCLPEVAVILRPGAPTRAGEAAAMAPALASLYRNVVELVGPGTIEGGDILTTGSEVMVGLSERTTSAGVAELAEALAPFGYQVTAVETPEGVLHFKTECSLLDATTVLATRQLAASGAFANYTVIEAEPGEEAAANSIRVNDVVFMPQGYPRTSARVRAAGFDVVELPNSECHKIDGGLSCLSLRFSPS